MSTLTELEKELLAVIREYRRLGNQTCTDVSEAYPLHRRADQLLKLEPELDNPKERWNDPGRASHREWISSLSRR